jgi:hypothetical protein
MPRRHSSTFVVGFIAAFLVAEHSVSQEERSLPTTQNETQTLVRGQDQRPDRQRERRGEPRRSRDGRRSQSRRSERVRMQQIEVISPNGNMRFVLAPNAERLTYLVRMGDSTVVESSELRIVVDGYDLPSGVVLGAVETYEID